MNCYLSYKAVRCFDMIGMKALNVFRHPSFQSVFTASSSFVDLPDLPTLPETYRDSQRTVIDKTVLRDGKVAFHASRVAIFGQGAVLGNCRHTFRVRFRGRGGGGKLILIPPGCVIPPKFLDVFTYELPKHPWKLVVEPGAAYAFVFGGTPDVNGEVTVVISEAYAAIVDDPDAEQVNTFSDVIVEPS